MKYTVIRPVQLPVGTLVKISDDLAKRHAANLAHVKGKQFMCLGPMWLKAGQVIDLGDPPKHVMDCLVEGGNMESKATKKPEASVPADGGSDSSALADDGSDAAAAADSDPAAE